MPGSQSDQRARSLEAEWVGFDRSERIPRIHPPDVIGKYAPDAVIGKVGTGAPAAVPAASGGAAAPLLEKGGHKADLPCLVW